MLALFSEDPDILRDLVRLEEEVGEDGVKVDPLTCVSSMGYGVCCMITMQALFIVSTSVDGVAKMMTVTVIVFEAAGFKVSEKKTETMQLRTLNQAPLTSALVIELRDRDIDKQCRLCTYLGCLFIANADTINRPDICRWIRLARKAMLQSVHTGGVRYIWTTPLSL